MTRFPPIAEKDLTDDQRAVVRALVSGPRGDVVGPFIALLRNPPLAARVEKVGEYLRFGGVLPKRLTELTILIVSEAWRSPFEWYTHAPLARKQGLAESTLENVGAGRRPDEDDPDVLAVYDFVSMLIRERTVTGSVYDRAHELFGDAGVIELIGVCGYYTLLAMILNVAETGTPDETRVPFTLRDPRSIRA
jgi:4-carboxymuconolactone decarboxylase